MEEGEEVAERMLALSQLELSTAADYLEKGRAMVHRARGRGRKRDP
jgi:hypothetical protein